ncbi:hypothetical protein B0J17DRAFT_724041 [Rhizoctonia solani]|nr:hypothetical protein B0J17DRAFT_724041 [Rhizoctonia solani]
MEARYSSLSYPLDESKPYPASDPESSKKFDRYTTLRTSSFAAWLKTIWTLALHFILSLGASAFLLFYVHGRHFNVAERTPPVDVVEGRLKASFYLLQSDIVTINSAVIVALRCALMAWGASLIWRVAVFLMERRGLSRRDLKTLIHYGALLVANIASPVLTGSISWVPSNQLAHGLSINPARFDDIEDGIRNKQRTPYFDEDGAYIRQGCVLDALGFTIRGWGRDAEPGVLKRVSNSIDSLAINSTIENVTMPYFQVHSIQWIQNRDDIPAFRNNSAGDVLEPYSASQMISGDLALPLGFALLVPNTTTNWSSDPMESTIIRDTRLLAMYYKFDAGTNETPTPTLPPNAYIDNKQPYFYVYAWVAFSAGVGECKDHNCIVSSPSTVRNNTPVDLEPHQLTFQALALTPVVGIHLVSLNTSLPLMWNNIDDYVEAVLVRSYSGAWSALNWNMRTQTTQSSYLPSFPGLLALVDHRRVYLWLGLQLLVTLLGTIFLVIQSSRSKYPLIGDTTLTAFYVDSSMIPRSGKDVAYQGDGVLRIELQGARLRVKLERPDWNL